MRPRQVLERAFGLLGICVVSTSVVLAAEPGPSLPLSAEPSLPLPAGTSDSSVTRTTAETVSPFDLAAGGTSDLFAPAEPDARTITDPLGTEALAPVSLANPDPWRARSSREEDASSGVPIHPALNDRFFFGVGAFWATSTTEARLDSPSGIGTTVGFEDLLGLDNSKIVPQGLARWRMSERWRLELEFFELNRDNSVATTQDVTWGDQTFPAGTQINAMFDISVLRLSAGYSFFKTPDKELGVALGFHLTDIDVSLSSGGVNEDSGELLAPLPVLSLYGQVALTETWALSGRLDAFRMAYDPYEGHIFSMGVDAICQPWRHLGFGLGWRTLEVEASASNEGDWEGAVRSHFSGPIAFVAFSF